QRSSRRLHLSSLPAHRRHDDGRKFLSDPVVPLRPSHRLDRGLLRNRAPSAGVMGEGKMGEGGTGMQDHSAGPPVPYMERTRNYYRALGYTKDYVWAHHAEVPFVRPVKPVGALTVALVCTAGPGDRS